MNEFINSIYITGGISKMLVAEFLRGLAWSFGACIMIIALIGILTGIFLLMRYIKK